MASRQLICEEAQKGPAPRLRVLIADHDTLTCEALAELVISEESSSWSGRFGMRRRPFGWLTLHVPMSRSWMPGCPGEEGQRPCAGSGTDHHRPVWWRCRRAGNVATSSRCSTRGSTPAWTREVLARRILHAIHHVGRGQIRFVPDLIREMTTKLADQDRDAERDRRRTERVQRLVRGKDLGVVFQPIVDLRGGRVVAVEALARMSMKPTRSPAWWIGEAWALGLGVDLELAALRAALGHLERLPREVLLTVNVSPRTFVSPELIGCMDGLAAGRVVVEVTEDAPVEDYDVLEDGVRQLRARGVRLAIDDAGAGFSSLGGILRLAPEFIKLDISLIRHHRERRGGTCHGIGIDPVRDRTSVRRSSPRASRRRLNFRRSADSESPTARASTWRDRSRCLWPSRRWRVSTSCLTGELSRRRAQVPAEPGPGQRVPPTPSTCPTSRT